MENFVSDIFAKKDETPSQDQAPRPMINPTNIKVVGVGGGGGNAAVSYTHLTLPTRMPV